MRFTSGGFQIFSQLMAVSIAATRAPPFQHTRQMILHPRHAGKLDDKRQPLLMQEHLPKRTLADEVEL